MNMTRIAEEIGAVDIFVLKKMGAGRYFNLNGHGRGRGWAGNVTVDASQEPWLAKVLTSPPQRRTSGVPFRAFGPYWCNEVAATTVGEDLVVFGGAGVASVDDEGITSAAERAATGAEAWPAQDEADELEIRQAIATISEAPGAGVDELGQEIVTAATQALSCDFGALLLYGPPQRLFVADEGWQPAATRDEIVAALLPLRPVAAGGIMVEQDLGQSAFPYPPLSFDDGLVARCTMGLGQNGNDIGLLTVAHAAGAPRGFTSLCRRVAEAMAETGSKRLSGAAGL